jgi:hypothetical protein
MKGVPIYHPRVLYKIGAQYCALQTYVHGDQSHNQYEAEENDQSNGKRAQILLMRLLFWKR